MLLLAVVAAAASLSVAQPPASSGTAAAIRAGITAAPVLPAAPALLRLRPTTRPKGPAGLSRAASPLPAHLKPGARLLTPTPRST